MVNNCKNVERSPKMLRKIALMLFLTVGFAFSSLMAQNQSAATGRTISQQVSATRVGVTGQLPAAAKVAVTPVQRTAVQGKQVKGAYDITIQNGTSKWQPAAGNPVMVTIADPDFTDGEYLDVYHEGANGPEFVATVSPENGKITFPARSFSVYIVTESGAGARLKVNFHQTDGTVVSIFVKAADAADEDTYKTVLYDPGVGTIADGIQFRGWTTNANYAVADADDGMTIAQVRTWVQPQLANVTDGTTVELYPMLFKLYRVTYYDELGTILSSQEVLFLVSSDMEYHDCYINEAYFPSSSEQNFLGWNVTDGGSNINGYTAGTLYQNQTTIQIKGNIKLRAYVPYGHWLVFNENGSGASFTAAQFLENNQVTTAPSNPTRFGYTFGGWYTDEACTGNTFTFGNTIAEHTTLYAKWTANTTANYTIIIWKQNVHDAKDAADADKTYDFAESVSLTGPVGDVISTVTAQGTGNNRYAIVNETNKQYTGFHLNTFDENVTIVTEGTSVLNVYYDRNLVTLTFLYRNNNQWADFVQPMTGLYGSSLTENGYTWPTGRWWYDDYIGGGPGGGPGGGHYSSSGTRTTFLDAFLLSDGSDSQTFYGFEGSGNGTVHFMKQNDAGEYTEANNVITGNGDFLISDKYNGYKAVSYSTNNSTWTSLGEKDDNGYYGQVSNYTNLYIRYAPLTYSISYNDGVYKDGNNNPVDGYNNRGLLNVAENIPFESSIASYNEGGDNYYAPTFDGFVFAGWYVDDACTQPYTFTTMPEGITVYAKWIQIQYRVFFHPNAVDPETGENDPTFDWPAGQAFNFRESYGGKVQTPTANRDDYTLVGWYTDEACTQVFNGDMITLNDQTVTTPYDKTVDKTDPVDAWGDIATSGAYNSDITGYNGGDRFWITRKLDLYAKWRSKLEGAKGIHIQYVFIKEEDVNVILVQEEEDLFNDNVTTFSIPAPTSFVGMPNPQDSVFFQWVVMHYDATSQKFVDSDERVYPGSSYTVNKSDAMKEENPDYATDPTQDQYIYTIQVRAEYIPVEKVAPTFIVWYNNYENADPDTVRQDGKLNPEDSHENLFINQAVSIPVPAARSGYKFLGWYKANIENQDDVQSVLADQPTAPNFLFYNETDEKFYAEAVYTTQADSVAADEANPYDYLYAVWEQTCTVPEVTVEDVAVCQGATATLQATITEPQDGVTYTYQWYTVNADGTGTAIEGTAATGATYETTTDGTYGVIVSAGDNCESEMDTATVTVWALPTITANATPARICDGGESQLSATGASNYHWDAASPAGDGKVTPTKTTTYHVTATDINDCQNTAEVTVYVNPVVTAKSITDQTVCNGGQTTAITFEPTENITEGTITWAWTNSNTYIGLGESGTDATIPAFTATNNTASAIYGAINVTPTYSYDSVSCAGEVQTVTYITVNPSYNVTDTKTICASELPYTWNGEQFTAAGTKTVSLVAANGCDSVVVMTLTVNELPEVTINPAEVAICAGKSTTLTATGAAAYVWSTDATTAKITVDAAATYTVTGTDANGCTNTANVTVTVNALPTVDVTSTPACEGSNAVLTATTNAANASYQWMDAEGNAITGATSATYKTATAGSFTVQVTDGNNCTNTKDAIAVINLIPGIGLTMSDQTCTYKGVIHATVGVETTPDYKYYLNDTLKATTNATSYTYSNLSAGSYIVRVEDANGCATSEMSVNIAFDQSELSFQPIQLLACNSYEFDTIPQGASDQVQYTWSAPTTSDAILSDVVYDPDFATTPQGTIHGKLVNTGNAPQTATYTVTPLFGDCQMPAVTVNVTVSAQILPEVSLVLNATSPVCSNAGTIEASATVSNSYAADEYNVNWTWQDTVTPQTVSAGTTSITHEIAIPSDVTEPTSYTLKLSYSDGVCTASTSTEIAVVPLPTLNVTNNNQTITYGESITDALITNTYSTLNLSDPLPEGFVFDQSNQIVSAEMPKVGRHVIYLTAQGNIDPGCGTVADSIVVVVNPKPITLAIDASKIYDHTPLIVKFDSSIVTITPGLVDGDALIAGVAKTDNFLVGHYTYTPTSGMLLFAPVEGNVIIDPVFNTTNGLENYEVTYDIAMDITIRHLEITAADASKVYDGTALTSTDYTIADEDGIADLDAITSIVQTGSQLCVGTSPHTISDAVITGTEDGLDVTDQYEITYVDGTLEVTAYTEFSCPEDIEIVLNFGQCDTMFEPTELATISEDASIAEGMYTITNNLNELNPLDTGVHVITWMLTDDCGNTMATCEQTVTVTYPECPVAVDNDGNQYESVRIDCECWTKRNLESETYADGNDTEIPDVMTYYSPIYFNDEDANLATYGHLYTWEAAVNDGADNGYGHVQGICPEGWYLPTKEQYESLNAYGPDALRAEVLWADGAGTNTTGFTALPGGRYVGNIDRYEDLTIKDYYWATTTTEAGAITPVEVELTMNCLKVTNTTTTNLNGFSIRCIKEREEQTETPTVEP